MRNTPLNRSKRIRLGLYLALGIGFLLLPAPAQEEAVDGIVAVVNNDVITLTDFRIAQGFGFYSSEGDSGEQLSAWEILDRLIEQKLIVWVADPDLNVPVPELEVWYERLSGTVGAEAFQRRMEEFDLTRDEFYVYLAEMIASRGVLEQRFQMAVTVSLREIEAYYNETYVPEQTAMGLEPEPMVEILDKLETAVKSDGTRVLIGEWVRNLRKEADIDVFAGNYPQYFERIQRKGP